MSTHNDTGKKPTSPEEVGLSPTPTTDLSGAEAAPLYNDVNDPNAAAMNENADAAQLRQLTGEPPDSASAQNPGGLPPAQSPVFEEGT